MSRAGAAPARDRATMAGSDGRSDRGVRQDRGREPADHRRIRVLIVDDHELYRRGLQIVLGVEDGIEVVGEAADGVEAVDRAEELAARRRR